jgi:hypothetical protein
MADQDAAVQEERRRVQKAQYLVDVATQMIEQGGLARAEAEQLVSRVRSTVLRLFPDGADTWDVLYGRRFARLIEGCPESVNHPVAVAWRSNLVH